MFRKVFQEADPVAAVLVSRVGERQRDQIERIAWPNIVPLSVPQAQGTVLTNTHAEGYPGCRDDGGWLQ